MRARLLTLWDSFRSGFWFVPLLFVLVALALGLGMPVADSRAGSWVVERAPWMATTTEAARPTLSAIGGAMITVTGVVFSITVVTLSIASSQFGSRMLRNFMDDRVTQSAIGMFLATSAYCFLMMRSVRDAEGTMFTPHLSVALSMLLAMISVGMLIFYIHHVALAIQAPQVVASLAVDLDHSIERLFPEKIGDAPGDEQSEADAASQLDELDENYAPLISDREGYLQAVDAEGLIRTASDHELLIQLDIRPGAFVVCDVQIARVWPAEKLTDEIAAKLNGTMIVGKLRTPRQDVQCAIDEIVEVAVRALSPGINAPFTAMTCIDRLGAALGRLAGRKVPSPYRHDPGGQLRLVGQSVEFADVLEASFGQIRQYGKSSVAVMSLLLRTLQVLPASVRRVEDCRALAEQAERTIDAVQSAGHQQCDLQALQAAYDELNRLLASRRQELMADDSPAGDDADGAMESASQPHSA